MIGSFLGCSIGLLASNYVYQFFCASPDWAIATERSVFQLVAIVAVGATLGLRSIAP